MAYLETLEDEERKKLELGGGAAPISSGGTGAVQSQPKAPEPGFQNLANYFTANKDAAQAQGAQMASGLETAATEALQSDSPGEAMDVYGQLGAAQTPGGLATTIEEKDDPLYTGGMAGLDAYLGVKGAEPGAFQGLKDLFGEKLLKVEAPVEDPGAPPPYLGGPGLDAAWEDWAKRMRAFEDWRKRRAKNIGEDYVPKYSDTGPVGA